MVIKKELLYWDDIPYAQPPVLTFKMESSKRVNSLINIYFKKEENFVSKTFFTWWFRRKEFFVGTEDCLYLDIKLLKKQSNLLPVMFWIHGGGNTSGLKDLYDFNKMVKRHNVIVVRINYRLGPFGWFTHPSIQDFQNDIDKTSNFGTLDIIAALNWVKKILAFLVEIQIM